MISGRLLERRKFPRIATNGNLPGRLLIEDTNQEVNCRSIDVSKIGLGIESSAQIPINTILALEFHDRKVQLRLVAAIRLRGDNHTATRYGLLLLDSTTDLEAEFRKSDCLLDDDKPLKRRVVKGRDDRAPRFQISQEIVVQIQTFGSRDPHTIAIENMSRSGLLIATATDKQIPFKLNTLVDLIIDPDRRVFSGPIHATGRIVRRIDEVAGDSKVQAGSTIRFGIAIGEISPTDEKEWRQAFDDLEVNAIQG